MSSITHHSNNVYTLRPAEIGWDEHMLTVPNVPLVSPPEYIDLGMLPPDPDMLSEMESILHIVVSAAAAVSAVALIITICLGAH